MEWINRGGVLIRRINSERIAEDPHIKYYLHAEEQEKQVWQSFTWTPQPIGSPDEEMKVHWTEKVVQHLHHATYQLKQEDVLMQISPRIAALSIPCLDLFAQKLSSGASTCWKEEERVVELLNTEFRERYSGQVGIFDVGMIDRMKTTHARDVFDHSFGDGRISALKCSPGELPTVKDLFIGCSTVSAWLALRPDNVTVVLAPNHARAAVFLACLMMYCSDPTEEGESLRDRGMKMIEWYVNLINSTEGVKTKLSCSTGTDTTYTGELPRNVARLVSDFAALLEKRDLLLANESKRYIAGLVAVPRLDPVYLEKITLLPSQDSTYMRLQAGYRPYFVIHDEKGLVVYSSLIHGIHNVQLSDGPHEYIVNRRINPGDIVLKMYHVPKGVRGETIFTCRLHTSSFEEAGGEMILRLSEGHFDSMSVKLAPPSDFAVRLTYHRADPEEKKAAVTTEEIKTDQAFDSDVENLCILFPSLPKDLIVKCRRLAQGSTDPLASAANVLLHNQTHGMKEVSTEDFCIESYCYENEKVHVETSTGTKKLLRIELRSDTPMVLTDRHANTWVIFVVVKEDRIERLGRAQVLGPLPDPVRRAFSELGIQPDQEQDARFARNLQASYRRPPPPQPVTPPAAAAPREEENFIETALQSLFSAAAGGWELVSRPPRPPRAMKQAGGGASSEIVQQLPIYPYKVEKDKTDECLICQYVYESGDKIKTLPCFHIYHSDCIDPWLLKNGTCPVCQRHIAT